MNNSQPIFCPQCGQNNLEPGENCIACGQQLPKRAADGTVPTPARKELKGIRGWLAYFAFGMIVSAGFAIYNAYSYLGSVSEFGKFSGQGRDLGVAFALLALSQAAGVYLIFRHKKAAKAVMIWSLAAGIVVYGADTFVAQTIYESAGVTAPSDLYSGFGRTLILAPIWMLYFVRSRRVANTLNLPGFK